jgi:hypothetical protein
VTGQATNEDQYLELVRGTLCRHINALNKLSKAGLYFFDYGNAFLLEAGRAGADVFESGSTTKFKYPSYVQHIMGDIFRLISRTMDLLTLTLVWVSALTAGFVLLESLQISRKQTKLQFPFWRELSVTESLNHQKDNMKTTCAG